MFINIFLYIYGHSFHCWHTVLYTSFCPTLNYLSNSLTHQVNMWPNCCMIHLQKPLTFDLFEFGDYIAHKSGGWGKKEIPLFVRAQIQFSLEQIDLQQGYINNTAREKRRRQKIFHKMKTNASFSFWKWFSMSSATEELFLLACLECGLETQILSFWIIHGITGCYSFDCLPII